MSQGQALTPEQQRLVEEYAEFAGKLAHIFLRRRHDKHFLDEDIRAAALEGLIQAALRYKPGREVSFSTWAKWWIRALMQQEHRRIRGPVHIPHSVMRKPCARASRAMSRAGEEDEEEAFWGTLLNHTPDPGLEMDARRTAPRLRALVVAERQGELQRPSFAKGVPAQVDMFLRWLSGERGTDIAREYGVHRAVLDQAVNRIYPSFARVAYRIRNEAA